MLKSGILTSFFMPNARQKILSFIIEQQSITVEELSKVFRVTPANIRHHLSILIEQGSIKVIGQKPAGPKGRPAQIYGSCQQSDQNNLDRLSDALLSILKHSPDHGGQEQWMVEIAKHIRSDFTSDFINPTRRLYSAIHSLNRMNYRAHWEAHVENPRIMLGHCPYQAVVNAHAELCQMDASLLEQLIGKPVRQVEKLRLNAKDLPECIFIINYPPV